ncbi:hypothetical protein PCANC_08409 [Puccinia coronata f. sp. avenae]|nr:hypothetical protein PCANC_08225 [Puccinia coronata f. sp. avenae]PLW51964.1 hypothetical protein PCANC_08409 [Puccinia coronata f. sp. avenae]
MSGTGQSSHLGDDPQPKITPNPYIRLLEQIDRVTFPEYTGPVRKVLIAFGSIHAATVLVCIAVMLIPLRRGPEARKKFTWILRKKYVPYISTPYHVMNSGLIIVVSQLLSSLIFVTYIIIDYYSLNSTSFVLRACLHVCWELCLLPGYFGLHVTAFCSLYTYLCSPRYSSKRRRVFSHPVFLNILFYGLPIITTLQTAGWSVALALAVRNQAFSYNKLAAHLRYGASYWKPGQNPNNPVHRRAASLLAKFLQRGKNFSTCWVWSSRNWSVIAVGLAIFYAVTVANLLHVLRTCLKASHSTPHFHRNMRRMDKLEPQVPSYIRENLESPVSRMTLPDVPIDSSKSYPRSLQKQPSVKELKDGYIYLIVYCSIMLLDLLIHVTCTIIRTVHFEQAIVDKRWRSKTTWLVLLGSTLASVAMLFHSWRIFTERDTTNIPEPNPGILVRKFLTSHREGPEAEANAANSYPKQVCDAADQSQMNKFGHADLSSSRTPISNWSINPIQQIRSPPAFSPVDDINRYTSYEMPPVSERNRLSGYIFAGPEPTHVDH